MSRGVAICLGLCLALLTPVPAEPGPAGVPAPAGPVEGVPPAVAGATERISADGGGIVGGFDLSFLAQFFGSEPGGGDGGGGDGS